VVIATPVKQGSTHHWQIYKARVAWGVMLKFGGGQGDEYSSDEAADVA
jgi:hypothetical protein